VYSRWCGLDVYQKTVVACVLLTDLDGTVHREVQSFGAMTVDLLALNDWLNALRVEQVAMESTGIYMPPTMLLRNCASGSMSSRFRARAFAPVREGQIT
jgi:hypothetical protein